MQPSRHHQSRKVRHFDSPIQLSLFSELFADANFDPGNIISFSEVAEKHRRKMELKAYPIILDNIAHLDESNDQP